MNNADKAYNDLCRDILDSGVEKADRTGTGTLSVFGRQLRFDLNEGFPLLTGKRVAFRLIAEEIVFFLRGDTNLKSLLERKVDIWTRDGYAMYCRECEAMELTPLTLEEFRQAVLDSPNGYDLGPIYGAQWRSFNGAGGFDQLAEVIAEIKDNPDSRRLIVSAWNPNDLPSMALPPCHVLFQFYVADGKLSCMLYQRSSDVFLGLPFNIAGYALITELIAQICGLGVGELIVTLGDAHIYSNHIEQIKTQIEREPKQLPTLYVNPLLEDIDLVDTTDFGIEDYYPHLPLKGAQAF